ncbi:MAG: glutamine synthetase III [Bacteroidales bacterium]|nr:glutamine synthetase III [Bacteroidales bacterium]
MANFREKALQAAAAHEAKRYFEEAGPVSTYFGQNVFSPEVMREYMSAQAYEAVLTARKTGEKIDRSLADEIASGMKSWATERGATHYTHLFQPLTGSTAEKHEAFLSLEDGAAMENFKGNALVQQEPDASSFPNGGLRNTFEARGYSAWDPHSPAFILDETLCIPSVFVSYTGEALDMKVPNLRSIQALDDAATAVARLFEPDVRHVRVNVGLEQEYFLVDEALYNARPDLQLCSRTVIGHTSAKDQQLSDHYFGAIPSRVAAFMKDFETQAFKLGIPLQTRHNEVAPGQFECAPVFSEITTAIDQNMLLMIVMQKVAEKHHLKVIFHEKPFQGVNGSGKHCNWSMQTDTGVNLLSPGKTPEKNLRFLSFYVAVVKGVCRHQDLLMASVCSLSNSYRLGGHEAPPAVMSVFSGSTLTHVFQSLLQPEGLAQEAAVKKSIDLIGSLPEIIPDNTDRNRTSPFAFTGNRFEFRAVGASANAAASTYVLNAAVAESLKDFQARVEEKLARGEAKDKALLAVIRAFLEEAAPVMFEGNGYSQEWQREAVRRGLSPVTNVPLAFQTFRKEKSVELFSHTGVLTPSEIEARVEVQEETYVKKMQIEARVLGDVCLNHVIPAAVTYQNVLIRNIQGSKEIFGEEYLHLCEADIETCRKIAGFINALSADVKTLVETRKKANRMENMPERAYAYSTEVKTLMDKVRESADNLEMLVDDALWPLPKYRELLFF